MKPPVRSHGASAWAIGLLVLGGLGWSVWSLLASMPRDGRAHEGGLVGKQTTAPLHAKLERLTPATPIAAPGHRVHGIVRAPDGQPAAGAKVTIHRALTAWPEWQRAQLDQAVTAPDGAFVFVLQDDQDVLIEFEHSAFAGGLEELPPHRAEVALHLQPGFELGGLVVNDQRVPVGGARVYVESVLADQRRVRMETTTPYGGYRFRNLPAGPVRLVARHDQWQPKVESAVVIGETSHVDLRFERPAMAPLRGRVFSSVAQAPIGGATIELMATGSKLGLVAPALERSNAEGLFALAGLPRGPQSALVRHPEHGAVLRTVTIGAANAELTFELPPRSAVSGRLVTDSPQVTWKGLVVQISDTVGELDRTALDAEGGFQFAKKLSPGWATVTVLDGALAFQRSQAMNTKVRIAEAARTVLELPVTLPTVVRGRLVDERGAPLAGVTVQQTKLLAENARWISDAAASFDLGSFGSQVAQLVTYDRDQLLTVSLPDGTFEFRGQKPGSLVARFDLPGRGSKWMRIVVPQDGPGADLGAIVLPRGCQIQGRVTRGERGLAGALVTVAGAESQAMVVTQRDGLFRVDGLQPGEYRVRARLPSMPTSNAERAITVASTAPSPDVLLVLPPGRIVRGTVNGSDAQPVAGALVTVRGASGQPTFTDSNGGFLLEIPEGAVDLQVSFGDRRAGKVVTVRAGQDQLPAIKIDTPPISTLVATVAGLPGRKRLPGGLLRLSPIENGREAQMRTRWIEMQNGELLWPLCPAGRVRVQLWCDGYAPFDRELDFVANQELNLDEVLLEPGSRLQGRVVDGGGAPVADASVLLGEEGDLDLFEPQVRSGVDGTFSIRGVTSRSATLVVRAAGLAPRALTLALPQDVLGREPFVVVLEPGSTIEVVVREKGEGRLVQLRQNGRVLATAELDENGRTEFRNRGAGSYTVQVYGGLGVGEPVVVEGSGRVFRVQL